MGRTNFKNNIDRKKSRLGDAEIVHAIGTLPHENEPLGGQSLQYDEGFEYQGKHTHGESKLWKAPGQAAAVAAEYGFPDAIYGNPLGCGCDEAHLHAIGERQGDTIEMDYMCDVGYHNFVVFRIGAFDRDAGLKLNKEINLDTEEQAETKLVLGDDNEPPRKLQDF